MVQLVPHYLLFTESRVDRESGTGYWRFLLQRVGERTCFEVKEDEQDCQGDRLELLGVLRGLQALEQRSKVTIITSSRTIHKGLRHGLSEWRENDWCWERFGEMKQIKHVDLWRKIDRALAIHDVECRNWNYETASNLFSWSAMPELTNQNSSGQFSWFTRWGKIRWERIAERAKHWALRISGIEIIEVEQSQLA
ncbi:MAG TPA: hypothetical protein PKD64_00155 [Pirellulaceae bacterium]|nr:hypothetical protein [Pirellulaceae bacterium]HMO90582.1 hypothetical protein [Pirellulaceae bacterium]HMP67839.1 hypothetical protein [Pirellulaceae bacterium]